MRCFRHLWSSCQPITLTSSSATILLRSFSSSDEPSEGGRVALYFRRARLIDALRLRLRSADPSPPPLPPDPFVAVQALRSAPSPDSALSLFRSIP
ncbi:hypothetical protein B296_00057588, partial [Ensete ventricosum]